MSAYVENPEAVGDPNQTPRVRLWPAGELVSSERFNKLDADLAAATARAERAEAAIQRVRAIADPDLGGELFLMQQPDGSMVKLVRADAILAALGSTDTVEDAPETENGPALEGAEPSSNRVLIGVRSSAYAEPVPGSYWERAVLERFAAGQSIDLKTVREQLVALLRTIKERGDG